MSSSSCNSMGLPFMLLAFFAFAAAAGKSSSERPYWRSPGRAKTLAESLDPGDGVGGAGRALAGHDASDFVEAGQSRRIRSLDSAAPAHWPA